MRRRINKSKMGADRTGEGKSEEEGKSKGRGGCVVRELELRGGKKIQEEGRVKNFLRRWKS